MPGVSYVVTDKAYLVFFATSMVHLYFSTFFSTLANLFLGDHLFEKFLCKQEIIDSSEV